MQFSELEAPFGYVYAIGQLSANFSSRDVEKEYLQLLTPADMQVPTEPQRLYNVLSRKENIFLAREMAWVLQVENVATYFLKPRSQVELEEMIEAIKPDDPTQIEYDVVIGVQEPAYAGEEAGLPGAMVNRLFHFTARSFIDSVPPPALITQQPAGPAKDQSMATFRLLVSNIFNDMLQLAANTGDTDETRALNYVSINYPDIYTLRWSQTSSLTVDTLAFRGVDVQHSKLSGTRRIVDVIFRYENPSGVESRFYTSVDVTGQFPFLVTKLQPYFER
ncbi:Hypothetical protein AA314_02178 [Archangium gephyra]|uniref:PatG domain-containing protein n=1 Tax=Archangium gephyra TaxID=48 RepID=A0AAC8TC99_9BACT|nr:Hypothetical protein AA314_02178 [Archangium gephyra]